MMIPFLNTDHVLHSASFLMEEVRFNLIHKICEAESAMMFRREDSRAIIVQSGQAFPAWIWTEEGLADEELDELARDFTALFADRTTLEFVAKPGVAECLAKEFSLQKQAIWRRVLEMEAYHCPSVIPPQKISGSLSRPTWEDRATIANFFVGFIADCFSKTATPEQMLEAAGNYILSDHFYVWKVHDEIVSMANLAHRGPRHVRINEVYTPPLQRKKGYASALVAYLSQAVLMEGKIPMLYADTTNPDSNKVYRSIGYLPCGKLTQLALVHQEGGVRSGKGDSV